MNSNSHAPLFAGLALVVSGILHGIVWALTGESWEGPLSIRKPVLFGISTGVTLISLGWILQKLKPASYDSWLARVMASTLLIEVGLITMQYWRGQASHFNRGNGSERFIEHSMTILIVVACAAILDIARRSFSTLYVAKSMQLAIRGGMAFLLISCGLGFFILFYGEHLARTGQSPTIFGEAGVMKFPHGIVIHAIQFLPVFVWVMSLLEIPDSQKIRAVWFAIASLASFLLFSCWQTFSGLDRFDVGLAGGFLLAFGGGLGAATIGCVLFPKLLSKAQKKLDQHHPR